MEDLMDKLNAIYSKLEQDRTRAIDELTAMQADIQLVEPRYRHTAREICGQLIKLAIDASVAQAKVLEPLTKNQIAGPVAGVAINKKELLDALESIEGRPLQSPAPATPMEEVVPTAVLEAEALEVEELEKQLKDLAGTSTTTIDANGGK